MNESASKKKVAAKKVAAAEPTDTERGRPREMRVSKDAEITEDGHVILYARQRCTIHEMGYIEMGVRVLRLPPGCLFVMRLDENWIAQGMKLHEQFVTDECIVSMLVSTNYPLIVPERARVGLMLPLASARLNLYRGEGDG